MTDIDPLLDRTLPPPSGPPQPPFVPSARSTTEPTARAAARTTQPRARARRRHPAAGGRIVAAGLGATTMFGLIAVMGVAQAASSSTTSTPAVDSPITLTPLPTIAPAAATPAPTLAPAPTVAPVGTPDPSVVTGQASTVPAPIVLQARPDVQVVTPAPAQAAPAPVATTSGSA